MKSKIPKLIIISPCYNEEAGIESSVKRLNALYDDLIARGVISPHSKMLCVNDASKDSTWEKIKALCKEYPRLRGISLAKNSGQYHATMAGICAACDKCDAVITMDIDLQDDLNAIEKMVGLFLEGNEIVYGVKVARDGDSRFKRGTAKLFYRFQTLMGVKSIPDHSEFRLMSNKAIKILSQYKERNLYTRGVVASLGLPYATVDDIISERTAGESKYGLFKLINVAIDGITSFSIRPMRMIFMLGVISLFITIGVVVYVIVSQFGYHASGWTSLILSIWFFGSLILLSLGIIGEYIGRIYTEVKQRPTFIVEETTGELD